VSDQESLLSNWEEHFEWRYVARNYAPCNVLDFGCGYGYSDFYLARAGFRVFGYDPNGERIQVAQSIRSRRPPEIQERTEFSDEHCGFQLYDMIWSSHVFEHVPYDEWRQIFDSIVNGAAMLISVPLGYAYDMPEHIHHWMSGDELREKLEEYSGRKWEAEVDEENGVIRAKLAEARDEKGSLR